MTPLTETELSELSDDALIELCVARGQRDERPFRELFRRYQGIVWRVCYGVVRNPQDAEDLTQEVFFKVYRNLPKFEGRSSFKTWVYRIAFNTSQNELRRRSRRPQLEQTSVDDLAEVIAGGKTPEEYWLAQVRNRNLRQALEQLQPDQLQVIRLKDFEQRPYADIAEQLEISLSAAKMRVQRARIALQQIYNALEAAPATEPLEPYE